jgi:hypothetical protein
MPPPAPASTSGGQEDDDEGMKEFNHILQQAAALKTEQLAVDRRGFDAYPEWYQHSMFASAEDRALRDTAPFAARMAAAQSYKAEGNEMMAKHKDFNYAHICYGNALGMFRWLQNADPNWKKKAIDDKDITEHTWDAAAYPGTAADTEADTEAEAEAVEALMVACYLNLGLLYQKMCRWADAVRASDAAIACQPLCAKAHYRRAVALSAPMSAGATQCILALKSLKRAAEIDPSNSDIRNAYTALHSDIEKQKEKDNNSFKGFLNRVRFAEPESESETGPVASSRDKAMPCKEATVTERSNSDSNSNSSTAPAGQAAEAPAAAAAPRMSVEEAYVQLLDMDSTAARHYDSGLYAEAAELREQVEKIRREIDMYVMSQKEKLDRRAAERKAMHPDTAQRTTADAGADPSADADADADADDPELAKARAIAVRFTSDMTLRDAKAMLRGRGQETGTLIPRPALRLQAQSQTQTDSRSSSSNRSSSNNVIICNRYETFAWYWIGYQLRTRVYICELLCDLVQQYLPANVRVVHAQEEAMFTTYLIERFAADMSKLKRAAMQASARACSGPDQEEGSSNLLEQLMRQYEGKSRNLGFSEGLMHLSWGTWTAIFLGSILFAPLMAKMLLLFLGHEEFETQPQSGGGGAVQVTINDASDEFSV